MTTKTKPLFDGFQILKSTQYDRLVGFTKKGKYIKIAPLTFAKCSQLKAAGAKVWDEIFENAVGLDLVYPNTSGWPCQLAIDWKELPPLPGAWCLINSEKTAMYYAKKSTMGIGDLINAFEVNRGKLTIREEETRITKVERNSPDDMLAVRRAIGPSTMMDAGSPAYIVGVRRTRTKGRFRITTSFTVRKKKDI